MIICRRGKFTPATGTNPCPWRGSTATHPPRGHFAGRSWQRVGLPADRTAGARLPRLHNGKVCGRPKRSGPPTTSESGGHCGGPRTFGPSAGRARFLVARAPCRARFSPISVHPGPAGLGTVSVHDVAEAYTAQRTLRRFPYTTRHGGDCRTLYTGDPVRAGVCTLVAAGTVQTPVGTGLPVRKVPVVASGHCAPPPDVP